MADGATTSSQNGSTVLDSWSARRIRPIVVVYVVVVFAVFAAIAHFIVRSPEAVKALLMAAVGTVAATVPGVMGKIEYRMTASGIERRTLNEKNPGKYEGVFRWEELSLVVPMKHGFKYHKVMDEGNPVRRFWQRHVSDRSSGEIHVEKHDLERILGNFERQGIAIS